MAVILLVRHGQASFGLGDYDRLSARGAEQTILLGRRIATLASPPTRLWSGQLSRQRATLDRVQNLLPDGDAGPERAEDGRLDEFDHQSILRVHKPTPRTASRFPRSRPAAVP
jgi:broad specificity phosphatase PhoE